MPLQVDLVHTTPGRIRLRVPALRGRPRLAESLVLFLRKQPGIQAIRANPACQSLILDFDPACWTPESLLRRVEDLSPEALAKEDFQGNGRKVPVAAPGGKVGLGLALSSTAVGLGLLEGSLVAFFRPFLLVGSALPIFLRAFRSLLHRRKLNVDVLDASATALLALRGEIPAAAFMVWLVNLADYIRDRTMERSRKTISQVLEYRTRPAYVVREGQKVQVAVEEIQPGETVVVYPGDSIPVDGTVVFGEAWVDQRTLTGESSPVRKGQGDSVYAATVVKEGKVYLRAEGIGEETEAAKIVRLVEDTPARETRIQNYAERWADGLVPYSFAGAGSSLFMAGNLSQAASVLIIDYGTGIRVAAPTTVLASMTRAARSGILVKGGRHLEQLAEVDAIVFDKTGTLSWGNLEVVEVLPCGKEVTSDQVLALAASAEKRLTHPAAQAIVRAAERKGLSIPERSDSHYTVGLGVEAKVDGLTVLVGSCRYMVQKGLALSPSLERKLQGIERQAASPLCVAVDKDILGLLALADPLRPEAPATIRTLREQGIKEIVMLTGDRQAVAQQVAHSVGIPNYVAEVFPEEKVEVVKDLQKQGYKVAVVGDGINDSPALAQADVGIAIDGGADVARETAHVVLLQGGLWKIPLAIEIARESTALIRQNWRLIWMLNSIALGLAFLGGIGPIGATLISNGSTILATANALRPLLNPSSRAPVPFART